MFWAKCIIIPFNMNIDFRKHDVSLIRNKIKK